MIPLVVLSALLWSVAPAHAHEVRPAYLELTESASGEIRVLWKTPMRGELRLALSPRVSGASQQVTPVVTRRTGTAAVQTWTMRVEAPLRGRSLYIDGLDATLTDALVRVQFADGSTWTRRLTPTEAKVEIPLRDSPWAVAVLYSQLGVEHILLGVDHLLFVFALLLITHGGRKLVKTVTAFTLAHSITLALTTLDLAHVPGPPVEAVIALSIVFLAAEIVRARDGLEGVTFRAPWIVALIFGLIHGFGFAGALSDIGLPQGQIPLALLFFNLGVEVGQLAFIGAALSVLAVARWVRVSLPAGADLVPSYAIGGIAMFWVIQRIASF